MTRKDRLDPAERERQESEDLALDDNLDEETLAWLDELEALVTSHVEAAEADKVINKAVAKQSSWAGLCKRRNEVLYNKELADIQHDFEEIEEY